MLNENKEKSNQFTQVSRVKNMWYCVKTISRKYGERESEWREKVISHDGAKRVVSEVNSLARELTNRHVLQDLPPGQPGST
jgi:hypothetical protein